ncbi:MAG: DUF2336 domain-containing protein [Hyphomicrobiales bacterium]|nr:DUF2336 domain-containing protein [Hyphomicrobiales bacterium]
MIVEEFLRWVRTAPVGARAQATDALARAFLYSNLKPEVRESAEAAMTMLLDDPSPQVRRALAEALASRPEAPRLIILSLANDQPDIAEIVLERSPVLLDGELVDIVALGDDRVRKTIAGRPLLSPMVSAAIAEIGDCETATVLAKNQRARITLSSLHRLAERHGTDPDLRGALLARPNLPLDVRNQLIGKLGEALNSFVVERQWMLPQRAESVTREACDKATVTLAIDAAEDDLDGLVEHLRSSGRLNASLLLRAMCIGEFRLFEAALNALSGMPRRRIYAILERGSDHAFRALYDKAKLPAAGFPAFLAALHLARELEFDGTRQDRYRFARKLIDRLLSVAGADVVTDPDEARLIVLLRRFAADAARDAARDYADECTRAA